MEIMTNNENGTSVTLGNHSDKFAFRQKALTAVLGCLVVLLAFCGCDSEREYYDDIYIPLQDASEQLIIKEWRFLLGSGIEVYYQKNDDNPILLGKATGGDDGFCPFKESLYEFTQDGDSVTIKWCFNPSESKDKTTWKSKTFKLPQ
ncbi:MAG: hypothetical protein E7599_02330 [Ruminococcaceae bacterium]|nr:hypothetical protein [Oscillospiraceae bacterium]